MCILIESCTKYHKRIDIATAVVYTVFIEGKKCLKQPRAIYTFIQNIHVVAITHVLHYNTTTTLQTNGRRDKEEKIYLVSRSRSPHKW